MSDLWDRVVMRPLGYAVPEIVGNLTPEQFADISNGCGPASAKVDLVPDGFAGVRFTEVCNDHDAAYHFGADEDDKRKADRMLLDGLLAAVDARYPEDGIEQTALRYACRKVAFEYYLAVAGWGHDAFWAGKD